MRTKEEISAGIGKILYDLRKEKHLSKAAIADKLFMDERTWGRYESGKASPTAADLIWIFNTMKSDVLQPVLKLIYPDAYNLSEESSIEELRIAAAHYFLHVASDNMVREIDYLFFGGHGSNLEPQMQEFTMINHLPLHCRVVIAQMVLSMWNMAEHRGDLICTDHVMPDVKLFEKAIQRGYDAVVESENAYTTAME